MVDIVTSVCFTNLLDFSHIFVHSFDMKWPTQKFAELDILFVKFAWVWNIIQFLYVQTVYNYDDCFTWHMVV